MRAPHLERDLNGVPVLGVWDPATEAIVPVWGDPDTGGLRILNMVWNTSGLQWERMQQPQINIEQADLTASFTDVEQGVTDNYWKRYKYDYDVNDNTIYKGRHITYNAAESDTQWYIIKYTYDGSQRLIDKQYAVGAWTNRATLGW